MQTSKIPAVHLILKVDCEKQWGILYSGRWSGGNCKLFSIRSSWEWKVPQWPGAGLTCSAWRNPEPGHTLTWPPQTPARLLTHNQGCQVHIYPVEFIGRRSEVFCSNTLLMSMVLTSKTDGYCVKIVELWKGDQRYTQLLMSFVHFVVWGGIVCAGDGGCPCLRDINVPNVML